MQLREGEAPRDVLRRLLAHETQLTRLELPHCKLPKDDLSMVYQQLGSLTALRHLDTGNSWDLPEPQPSDYRALGRLQQLTALVIPFRMQARPVAATMFEHTPGAAALHHQSSIQTCRDLGAVVHTKHRHITHLVCQPHPSLEYAY